LDNRRSHIPENNCSKSQQQRWAELGDQKIAMKSNKNTGLSWGVEIFWDREGSEGGEVSGEPGAPLTIGGCGLAWAAPPGGEVAWWVPLRSPMCLSAPILT
jgi:hypothetical protein